MLAPAAGYWLVGSARVLRLPWGRVLANRRGQVWRPEPAGGLWCVVAAGRLRAGDADVRGARPRRLHTAWRRYLSLTGVVPWFCASRIELRSPGNLSLSSSRRRWT